MLQNAYFLAKIGADTTENEQHFAEILPTDACERPGPAGRPGRLRRRGGPRGPAERTSAPTSTERHLRTGDVGGAIPRSVVSKREEGEKRMFL